MTVSNHFVLVIVVLTGILAARASLLCWFKDIHVLFTSQGQSHANWPINNFCALYILLSSISCLRISFLQVGEN
jgi:hypothetical protein